MLVRRGGECRWRDRAPDAIIEALQRHRFGRSSEQLDPDHLQLGHEVVETALAPGRGRQRGQNALGRGSAAKDQLRLAAPKSRTDRGDRRRSTEGLLLLRRRAPPDRRGCCRATRGGADHVPGAGHASAALQMSLVGERGGPGPGAWTFLGLIDYRPFVGFTRLGSHSPAWWRKTRSGLSWNTVREDAI